MRNHNRLAAAMLAFALLATRCQPATGQNVQVLHSFTGGADGGAPFGVLVQATDGSLYGTTFYGGAKPGPYGEGGTVFKITTAGTLTILHSFTGGTDGGNPQAGLVQAGDGILYGSTRDGGANGTGTIFKITTSGILTTLYTCSAAGAEGIGPGVLLLAHDGNLYGVTSGGGAFMSGTLFRVTRAGAFKALVSFPQGSAPMDGVLQANDGKFYGATIYGGSSQQGELYRFITPSMLDTLYTFGQPYSGVNPVGDLIQGRDGSLYGMTRSEQGSIYGITLGGQYTSLHVFTGPDGSYPSGGLTQASDGNLYGMTTFGGDYSTIGTGNGVIFKVTPSGAFSVLHTFDENAGSPDGAVPYYSSLIEGSNGLLYGVTAYGGSTGNGAVFSIDVGLNPTPDLISVSPNSADASGPAFTLTVAGVSFLRSSTVNWNGSPLTTAFVSATRLTAAVPASLIAKAGKATITVSTPNAPASNSEPFTIVVTSLKMTRAKLTRTASTGSYTATVSLKNAGYVSAPNVQITKASLGSAAATTTLPASLGTVAAGATATISVVFPSSAGNSGSTVALKASGKFTGGTFSLGLNVKLP